MLTPCAFGIVRKRWKGERLTGFDHVEIVSKNFFLSLLSRRSSESM